MLRSRSQNSVRLSLSLLREEPSASASLRTQFHFSSSRATSTTQQFTSPTFFHKRCYHATTGLRDDKWSWLWGKKEEQDADKKQNDQDQKEGELKAGGAEPIQIEVGEDAQTGVNGTNGSRWAPILELPVESLNGEDEVLGMVRLNPNLVLETIRTDILNRVVVWQLAAKRQGTHKTKSRSEVRGGGRKPYPQKGTGRARAGSIRSPIRRGGGHAHPIRPRSYYFPLQTKVQRMGLRVALSVKYAQGKLRIIKNTEVARPKTKVLVNELRKKGWNSAFVVDGKTVREEFKKAANALPFIKVEPQSSINVYDILSHDLLVMTLEALEYCENTFLRNGNQFYEFPLLPSNPEHATTYHPASLLEKSRRKYPRLTKVVKEQQQS